MKRHSSLPSLCHAHICILSKSVFLRHPASHPAQSCTTNVTSVVAFRLLPADALCHRIFVPCHIGSTRFKSFSKSPSRPLKIYCTSVQLASLLTAMPHEWRRAIVERRVAKIVPLASKTNMLKRYNYATGDRYRAGVWYIQVLLLWKRWRHR